MKKVIITAEEIERLGFDWPKYAKVEDRVVLKGNKVDLQATTTALQASAAYWRKQAANLYSSQENDETTKVDQGELAQSKTRAEEAEEAAMYVESVFRTVQWRWQESERTILTLGYQHIEE